MPKFDSAKITAINARELVEELIIDGEGILTTYENKLSKNYLSEFKNILKYIEYAANGNSLPKTKLRKYGNSNGTTEYEFKSDHLRVWAIQLPSKKLVVYGGYKNSQDADERIFKAKTKQYLETVKEIDNGKKRINKK